MLLISIVQSGTVQKKEGKKYQCPKCKEGKLILGTSTEKNKKNWYCSNIDGCHYSTQDFKGRPTPYKECPNCSRVMKLNSDDGLFWSCTGWFATRNKCRCSLEIDETKLWRVSKGEEKK